MNLSQTDKIFGALLIGFLIYITVRGQLPSYMQLFTAGDATPAPAASSSSSSNPIMGIVNSLTGAANAANPVMGIVSAATAFLGF